MSITTEPQSAATDDTATEDSTTAETTEAATEEPEAPTEDEQTEPDEATPQSKAGREAAKYRRQLRDTETERDGLKSQVEVLQRGMIETQLGPRLNADVFWRIGPALEALLSDDGTIDTEAVAQAVTDAGREIGLHASPRASAQGRGVSEAREPSSFASAFAPSRD